MPDDKLERTVFPRGREGLLPEGPVAPGPGVVPVVRLTAEDEAQETMKNMERTVQALTPQYAAEVAAKTARAEVRGTVRQVLDEERKRQDDEAAQRKDRLRPFYGFMESLRNLAASGPGGVGPDGRTELVLKLYRLLESGGPKPSRVFQTQVVLSQEEALRMGDPDFEGRTMEWALQQGQFGRFEWRMLGWADGESILDTTCSVTVEPPVNYQPPIRPAMAVEPEPKPDPMEQLKGTLGLLGVMREALGLKGGGGIDGTQLEILKTASAAQAKLEASNEHRRELRELEDRHRKELEEVERKGYERGKAEGDRLLEAERLRWDLAKAQEAPEGPSFIQEVTAMLGGPAQVQGLVGAIVSSMNRSKAAPKVMPLAKKPVVPAVSAVAVNPTPVSPVALPEPTRAEHHQAMQDLDEVLQVLQEHAKDEGADPEGKAKAEQLMPVLDAYRERGLQDGSLGAWWAEWPQAQGIVDQLIGIREDIPGGEDMAVDLDSLKTLLLRRLEEGATDEAILKELRSAVPVQVLEQWREMLRFLPAAMAAKLLGNREQDSRLEHLVQEFSRTGIV